MWIIRISLDLYGNEFSPKKFIKELKDKIHVFSSNEPDDLNDKDPEGIYGFGSLSILSPKIYGLQYEMSNYEKWYFDFLDKNKNKLEQNNVTEINLFMDVFDNGGQLNFEILSRELLEKVGLYKIAIPISYYRISTEQIISMLKETDISEKKLLDYIEVD